MFSMNKSLIFKGPLCARIPHPFVFCTTLIVRRVEASVEDKGPFFF